MKGESSRPLIKGGRNGGFASVPSYNIFVSSQQLVNVSQRGKMKKLAHQIFLLKPILAASMHWDIRCDGFLRSFVQVPGQRVLP
jgi:hypothetical protein